MSDRLLQVEGLSVDYPLRRRDGPARAVHDVSLTVDRRQTVGLVGESGSGKSTIGSAILGLVPASAGRIVFAGQDITREARRRKLARRIQVVFQDPHGTLNPSRTIGQTLTEPLRATACLTRRAATERAAQALAGVGMPPDSMDRYPIAFSGGQRQRIAIARALTLDPELIICDEPTSKLDLSIQAQILNLLLDLQERLGLAYLFISHDIDVIRHVAHHTTVLYQGRVVEQGPTEELLRDSAEPYTRSLLTAHRGSAAARR